MSYKKYLIITLLLCLLFCAIRQHNLLTVAPERFVEILIPMYEKGVKQSKIEILDSNNNNIAELFYKDTLEFYKKGYWYKIHEYFLNNASHISRPN